jgi:photosystem II stability/assembly factor-like uncharacterized protein
MKLLLRFFLFIILVSSNAEVIGQWMHLAEKFDGGAVNTIKTIGNNLYVGTSNFYPKHNKIYKSSDSGQNWVLIDSINGYNDAFNDFAMLGNLIFVSDADSGIYKSADNGKSWNQIFYIPNLNNHYYQITAIDSILVVGVDGQLYQSIDSGATWDLTYEGSWQNPIRSLISNDSILFAGITSEILTSIDNGKNWSEINIDRSIGGFDEMVIKDTLVFASNTSRIYKSSDYGINWSNITNNLSSETFKFCFGTYNNNLLLATEYGVYVINDNGQTWIRANSGLGKTRVNDFDILDNFIFAATNNGVYQIDTSQITSLSCDYLIVGAGTTTPPSCSECSDGTAMAYAVTGFPPYTYIWYTSPVQTTQTAIGLSTGHYSYSITDSMGCVGTDSVYVARGLIIDENIDDLFFQIFPNPVYEYLTINLPKNTTLIKIKIFNVIGELEFHTKLQGNQINLDLSNLKNGAYIIEVETTDKIGRQKFIKQK